MVRSRRESHHSDGITNQKSPQLTSATKSAKSRHCAMRQRTSLFDHLVGDGKQRWWNLDA
jgi:hypothetical protein